MNVETLNTVGQIAGIGGLALGVFLLLFREIIRKRIFPQLTKSQSFRLLMTMTILVWTIAIVGIAAWAWTESRAEAVSESSTIIRSNGGVAVGGDVKGSSITVTQPAEKGSGGQSTQ